MAAAVETLHNATLVHDDLIDNALVRRGMTTLNAVWNKGATVLAGDYLFARAAGFAAETENVRVVQLFAETLRIICEGELRQLFSARQWRQAKEDYYPRIFAKTASLFASATRSGAILGGASPEQEQALYDYGHHLGMAFQIVDDILDYSGDEATLGKPVGGDLRQGIVTLPSSIICKCTPTLSRWLPAARGRERQEQRHAMVAADVIRRRAQALTPSRKPLRSVRSSAIRRQADLARLPARPIPDRLRASWSTSPCNDACQGRTNCQP